MRSFVSGKMDLRIAEISAISNSNLLPQVAINSSHPSSETALTTMMLVELYCTPVICLFGLVGNTLSTITFFRKPLRRTSCSIYLAVRSISDNGFLLALMLIWTSSVFDLELSRVRGICQTIVLLTYICSCVSVWLVVFLTFENYVRICHPFVVKSVCSIKPARILTSILCVCAFGVYNFPLWISNSDCTHNQKYCDVTQVLVYTDTLLTLIVPSLVIIGLMTAILYSIIPTFRCAVWLRIPPEMENKPNRKALPAAKITKMLFIVSLMFFVLNIPSHVIRLYILINSFIKGQSEIPNSQRTLQTVVQLIYYLSFAVNIIIYIGFGKNFRKTFKHTFCNQSLQCSKDGSIEAVNMVPKSQYRRRFSLTVVLGSKGENYLSVPNDDLQRPASVS